MFERIRKLFGPSDPAFQVGDLVICISSNYPANETEVLRVEYEPKDRKLTRREFFPGCKPGDGRATKGYWYTLSHKRGVTFHECVLRKLPDGDLSSTWDDVSKVTGWKPKVVKTVTKKETDNV